MSDQNIVREFAEQTFPEGYVVTSSHSTKASEDATESIHTVIRWDFGGVRIADVTERVTRPLAIDLQRRIRGNAGRQRQMREAMRDHGFVEVNVGDMLKGHTGLPAEVAVQNKIEGMSERKRIEYMVRLGAISESSAAILLSNLPSEEDEESAEEATA